MLAANVVYTGKPRSARPTRAGKPRAARVSMRVGWVWDSLGLPRVAYAALVDVPCALCGAPRIRRGMIFVRSTPRGGHHAEPACYLCRPFTNTNPLETAGR